MEQSNSTTVAAAQWLASLPPVWKRVFLDLFRQAARTGTTERDVLLLCRIRLKAQLGLRHKDLKPALRWLKQDGARAYALEVLAAAKAARRR